MYKPLDSKPNFPELEKEIQAFWEQDKTFQKSITNREGAETFVFFEGPPTANAAPALHHIPSRAFKDAMGRFQTMRGKKVLRKAGWDTHGLPVELQIEKKLGISGKKQIENIVPGDRFASIAEFNKQSKESVWQFKEEWEKLTGRMAYWVDLSDPYVTYDSKYIESVWWILAQLWQKNLVYQGHKVIPYCPRCGTALSSHEVAQGYAEVKDTSVFVKFKLNDQSDTYILSWTTTPWTLPGNVALAVGEDIEYAKVKVGAENWILAKERLSTLQESFEEIETLKGSDLVGLSYEPIFPGAIPGDKLNEAAFKVYAADFVTTGDGTGVVHTAVMYGEDDYELGNKVGLPKYHTVDETGRFLESVPVVGGMVVKHKDKPTENETTTKILDYLKENNLLVSSEEHSHTYPFCWRCGTPLLYYARQSWYIKMSELREKLLANNEQIKWEPDHIKDGRFGEWLKEVKDWAISRERYWGTPLPFWKCDDCGEFKVVSALSELPDSSVEPHRPYIDEVILPCDKCDGKCHRVAEVLDVWFDSGAMPYAQWHYPFENKELIDQNLQFPANFIAEGIDQTRGWFYTLLAISTALDLGPAYKSVISNGHIVDDKGQKMSKSKGNIFNPWEVFDKFGADAVRWHFYSINQPGESKPFSINDLTTTQRKVFNIVANVYNYFATYANVSSWIHGQAVESTNVLDLWINARLQQAVNATVENTENLNIFRAVRSLEDYINDLSTWYLRRSRNRVDTAFFATMHNNLLTLSKLIAPFAPFFAETLYQSLTGEKNSVHLTDMPSVRDLSEEQASLLAAMNEVRAAAEMGNAVRKAESLKVRQPLPSLVVMREGDVVEWSEDLQAILLDELNVKAFGETDDMVWREAGNLKFGLDKRVTPELQREGDMRELERAVQALRKTAELQVGDMAKLYYFTETSEDLIETLDLAKLSISEKISQAGELPNQSEVEISTGKVTMGIEKE